MKLNDFSPDTEERYFDALDIVRRLASLKDDVEESDDLSDFAKELQDTVCGMERVIADLEEQHEAYLKAELDDLNREYERSVL